ncbi:hypothetical protein [Kordia zhangzhouensis]|uniref:hypothetical protein n=1 Tax=Kordia zhangzhouensis TaxID=1620405 RepID=UPI00062976BE|nr:hypothetical protein [Kordia zhangzhouensis]
MKKITLLIIALVINSCSEMKDVFEINDSETITIGLLSEEVYSADEQKKDKTYYERREVVQQKELTGEKRTAFLKEFKNKDNYVPLARKCKYEPVFVLLVDDRPHAYFDVEYCPTVKFILEGKKEKYLDIVTENTLKELLDTHFSKEN